MKNFLCLLTAAITALALHSCGKEGETKTEAEKKVQPVKINEITLQQFQETYKVVGIVKPYETAKISSEEGGLITYQPFDKGSRVSRGQVVVRLRKEQDKAAYEQALTQFELAKNNFERMQRLYEEKVTTEQDFTNAKFQLELAEKSLDVLETRLDKSYVVSPISGIVDQKYMSRGEVCGPGTPILNVVDVSRVKISAGIPESYIGKVSKGSTVKITFDIYPGEEFTGTVSYVSPTLSTVNRTFEIEIIMNNRDGRLKPEMSANIEVTNSMVNDAVVLQQDLIVDYGQEKFVFVMQGDSVVKRILTLGGRDNNMVRILNGLESGDKLIIEGFQSVSEGDKVQVIN